MMMASANQDNAERILEAMRQVVDGESALDTVAATFSVICHALVVLSPDLQEALNNADRLNIELKRELLHRMAN